MNRHVDTFIREEEGGKSFPPYQPTFDFQSAFINTAHQRIADAPLKNDALVQLPSGRWFGKAIPGWLRRPDALKLYELAYFADGDILEVGCYHGLSTSILAQAARDSAKPKHVYSIDFTRKHVSAALRTLKRLGLSEGVTLKCNDGTAGIKELAATGKRFGFAFIDHSHTYDDVYDACRLLPEILDVGAFCLFHDFNDPRSGAPDGEYGVYQAVIDGLDPGQFEFCGIYGCTALYHHARAST